MGEVYRARDTRLGAHGSRQGPAGAPLLRRRAATAVRAGGEDDLAALPPPHLRALRRGPPGRDATTSSWSTWRGETLAERLAKGPLPLEQTLRCGIEIADALDKAHRQGIVHRDLKPGNVMLTKSGVKLLDFGLAKVLEPAVADDRPDRASDGDAPDAEGSGPRHRSSTWRPSSSKAEEADARTDIFALGAVLYEMATGRKAFSGASQASLISAIMSRDPPPISTVQPMTPPALDRLVEDLPREGSGRALAERARTSSASSVDRRGRLAGRLPAPSAAVSDGAANGCSGGSPLSRLPRCFPR